MEGIVTDIQRFSLHDGPGIRSTVFLKGCNMRCAWCHNPETLSASPELELFPDKCIGCGECFKICPNRAHEIKDGQRIFHRELCVGCGACARVCYAEALVLVGRKMEASDVLREVMQDKEFYHKSGGGITVSGGEPLFQRDFSYEILRLCKDGNIHTAIETNMSLRWSDMAYVLPVVDLVMADIKSMDSTIHKKWTGISNTRILTNIEYLSETNTPMIIRTPIIPGVNDTTGDIDAIASFVSKIKNVLYYELLPYHPLGVGKYRNLGVEYKMGEIAPPNEEKMKELADTARKYSVEVRVPGGKGRT